MTRILILTTSNDQMGKTGQATGLHLGELVGPYYLFADKGTEVVIGSVKGGSIPIDPGTELPENDKHNADELVRYLDDEELQKNLEESVALMGLEARDFDALYIPGGHGTMWDMPDNETLGALIGDMLDDGKVVGAVCHGPAALVGAKGHDGQPIVAERKVNCFTDAEERKVEKETMVPFMLETRLRELGAKFESQGLFQACVVVDGNLVTGQNPASAKGVAEKMLSLCGKVQRADAKAARHDGAPLAAGA